MVRKVKVEAETAQLPSNFHTYLVDTIKGTFKNSIVQGLPAYIKDSTRFIDYVEETVKEVSGSIIKSIVADKFGMVKVGNNYRLHNETKHPLAGMINSLFKEEVESLIKSVGKELVESTIAEIKTSIQEDGEFVKNVKESIRETVEAMVVEHIRNDIVTNSKEMVQEALEDLNGKL
jgi:hypothetical protein